MACVSKAFNKQSNPTYNFEQLIYYFMFMSVTEFHKILTSNQNQNYLKVKQRSPLCKKLYSRCLVLVVSRNGLECGFTIEFK